MNRLARRAWFALVLAGILSVGLLIIIFRYFTQAQDWVTFQNSPHVYNNGVMDSGMIVTREGTVVLDATSGRDYADDEALRRAMLQLVGDTQGNITPYLLNEYGDELIGFNLFSGTHHVGTGSGVMHLTLSADAQRTALWALNGRKGTVGVYNYETGEILCMVSTPNFDPENVPDVAGNPETYDGVYVNRFVHSTYAPGSTFKLVTAAAALDEIDDIRTRSFYCSGSAEIGGETVICNGVHGSMNFEQALCQSCNVAFAEVAAEMGAKTIARYAEKFGINESLTFDGIETTPGHFNVDDATTYEAAWAAIGQYTDQINPCQYMHLMGAIANGGKAAVPYLVESVTFGESTKYEADTKMGDSVMSSGTASELTEMMHYAVQNQYGSWYFNGLYGAAKSGTAERSDGQTANALFSGFVKDSDYPLAFVVVVEGGGAGGTTCAPIIQQVLYACMASMDQS